MKFMVNPFVLAFICLMPFGQITAQESVVTPPSEGKAVIYFVRTGGTGGWFNFRFFEKENYLGKFQGKNYIRHECDPGEYIFWVKAENIDFIETDLKEGGTYLVQVAPVPGAFHSGVKFRIVDYSKEKLVERIHRVLRENEGVAFSKDEQEEGEEDMAEVINSGIRTIQKKRQRKKKVKRITQDMTYPFL